MPPRPRPQGVIHKHVALMVCEDAAVLAELLKDLDLEQLPYARIGSRALAAPYHVLEPLLRALQKDGVYPRVLGVPPAKEPS